MDYAVYPEGLYRALIEVAELGFPIYVTENGVADAEDRMRERYLVDHLRQIYQAIQEDGVPVKGYFYWSLFDNYEWSYGFKARYGLFKVDMETKERTPTRAASTYRGIATGNKLPA